MILIADSGSTKTDWCLTDGTHTTRILTQGINPYMQGTEEIERIIREELSPRALSYLNIHRLTDPLSLYFYGAGCTPEKCAYVKTAIEQGISDSHPTIRLSHIEVGSDLLGAARALFGHQAGIACILGTGSNSCYYDGDKIVENISPLGFILGDEGSGAVLGKQLVGNCLKRQFPPEICQAFETHFHLSPAAIIQRVYREPMPNRFLAGLSPFLLEHREHPAIQTFLVQQFNTFFSRNVALYHRPELPVSFIGSIAFYYQKELALATQDTPYIIGSISRNPIEGLMHYHLQYV